MRLDEKVAPELYGNVDDEALRLYEMLLGELASSGWISLRVAKRRDFQSFAERNPSLELLDFNALAGWAGFESRHVAWDRRFLVHLRTTPENWFGESRLELFDYLSRSPLWVLEELPLDEAVACLLSLQEHCTGCEVGPLREVSARVFQGRSKVLDSRQEMLRLLGAREGLFTESPIQLLAAAPERFDHVLFVENLVTFERMADERRPRWETALLLFAAGFKGSARRLRTAAGSRLYLRSESGTEGAAEAVSAWLYGQNDLPVFFFGDLDYSGVQILGSLREAFPSAQAWQTGYAKLASILDGGGGHSPESADKEGQTDPGDVGCPYADRVLTPLMRREKRFVDQEAVSPEDMADG